MQSIFAILFSCLLATTGFAQAPNGKVLNVQQLRQQFEKYEAAQALTSSGKRCRSSKECGHGVNCLDTFTGGKCEAHPCGAFYGKCVSGETCNAFGTCCGFTCH
jgi:hypothetical protein